MLQLNYLYSLIQNKLYTAPEWNEKTFSLKADVNNNNYCIYELPATAQSLAADGELYAVTNHHLSFYELQDNQKYWLSQYHYTAYLKDKDKIEHQLHVYFNHNDQVERVVLTSLSDNVKEKVSDDLRMSLVQLAQNNSKIFMSRLRQEAQQSLERLEKNYKELEAKLADLSKDLKSNKDLYQSTLLETIKILELLKAYSPQYAILLKVFDRINVLMNSTIEPANNIVVHEAALESKTDLNINEMPIISIQDNKLDEAIKNAKNAHLEFLKMMAEEKSNLKAQVPLFIALQVKVSELSMLLEEKDILATQANLQEIQGLLSQSTDHGNKLLSNLLLKNEFELASSLCNLADSLSPKYFLMALKCGNAKLLDFLCAHGSFAINTFLIDGVSPVVYCYLNHTAKTPKLECLSVLVKYNASLLTQCPDGLPVAHHIYKEPNHPLARIFIDYPEKTVTNPHFISTLCAAIKNYIASHSIDEKIKRQLEGNIFRYKSNKDLVKSFSSSTAAAITALETEQKTYSFMQRHTDEAGMQELILLRTDKEIMEKRNALRLARENLLKKLSPQEKRKTLTAMEAKNKETDEMMDKINIQDAKENMLKLFSCLIEETGLLSERADLNQSAKKILSKKDIRALNKRMSEIEDRLSELKENIKEISCSFLPEERSGKPTKDIPRATLISTLKLYLDKISNKKFNKSKLTYDQLKAAQAAEDGEIDEELEVLNDDEIFSVMYNVYNFDQDSRFKPFLHKIKRLELLNVFVGLEVGGSSSQVVEIDGQEKLLTVGRTSKKVVNMENNISPEGYEIFIELSDVSASLRSHDNEINNNNNNTARAQIRNNR